MDEIIEKLESLNESAIVTFDSGYMYELTDFEQVDESIYDSKEFVLAQVIENINGDKRFFTPGTLMEFKAQELKSSGASIYG